MVEVMGAARTTVNSRQIADTAVYPYKKPTRAAKVPSTKVSPATSSPQQGAHVRVQRLSAAASITVRAGLCTGVDPNGKSADGPRSKKNFRWQTDTQVPGKKSNGQAQA